MRKPRGLSFDTIIPDPRVQDTLWASDLEALFRSEAARSRPATLYARPTAFRTVRWALTTPGPSSPDPSLPLPPGDEGRPD